MVTQAYHYCLIYIHYQISYRESLVLCNTKALIIQPQASTDGVICSLATSTTGKATKYYESKQDDAWLHVSLGGQSIQHVHVRGWHDEQGVRGLGEGSCRGIARQLRDTDDGSATQQHRGERNVRSRPRDRVSLARE